VSLSGNFNKPVVLECPKEKIDDIFASISFSSPLQDLGQRLQPHLAVHFITKYPQHLFQSVLFLTASRGEFLN
jgi:hypothetical protein